jgi:hypothetical protein
VSRTPKKRIKTLEDKEEEKEVLLPFGVERKTAGPLKGGGDYGHN